MRDQNKPPALYRFLNGRGLYALLALMLVAACGIGVAIFTSVDPDPVDRNLSGIPDTRPTTVQTASPTQPTYRTTVKPTTTTKTPTTATTVPTTKPPLLRVLPLSNEVLAYFSDNAPQYNPTLNLWQTHNGVDFAGKHGQKVVAICDGTVIAIREDVRMGNVIEIRHDDGVISRYAGVTAKVQLGQQVSSGTEIGTLGEIPGEAHLQSHLHLETEQNGKLIDPIAYIGVTVHPADSNT